MIDALLADERGGWIEGLTPPPELTLSDWSDEFRFLNQKNAAEWGKWRTSRTPYLRQIMDDLSNHSPVQRVTIRKGAQLGGTELGNNFVGYCIAHAPAPMMVVQVTEGGARLWSKQRLAPMIEDMPNLRAKITPTNRRNSGNTVLLKEFDGGILRICGAQAAPALRMMPVKNLMLDEVDGYPQDVDGEGDPVELAINRTSTFSRRKILEISTPTLVDYSRITVSFEAGTMSYYFVPCPECGGMQTMEMDNLKWKLDDAGDYLAETAELACIECGALIPESEKTHMLERGEWRDTKENPKHKSYHINSLYSPIGWRSWAEIVSKYFAAQKSDELMKTFTNTVLAMPYEAKAKKLDASYLEKRAEDYPLQILPMGCLMLTAGVDVQDNRIEIYVIGHSMTARWLIDHALIWGSPGAVETWRELDDYLRASFDHAGGGSVGITATAIDSGGHFTQQVYEFTRLRKHRKIIAIKGASNKGKPIIGKAVKVDVNLKGQPILKNGAEVWQVGTDTAKDQLYSELEIDETDAIGYIHFSKQLPRDFYRQLTSEKKLHRYVKGFPVYDWILPKGARNEALDCFVYALAAFWMMGLNRWRPSRWQQLEDRIQPDTGDLFVQAARIDADADHAQAVDEIGPHGNGKDPDQRVELGATPRARAKRPRRSTVDRLLNG